MLPLNLLKDCKISLSDIKMFIELVSHIIISIILIITLKQKPQILTILLFFIVAYLGYNYKNEINPFILISTSIGMFVIYSFINKMTIDNYGNKEIINNAWQVPFNTIMLYYIVSIIGNI